MTLKYLGTAASEGWPAIFCKCPHCERAWNAGGKNIRTRSQALLDGKILIDFPPDTYSHFLTHKVDTDEIETLIITHSHSDHFYPPDLQLLRPPYAYRQNPFTIYLNKASYKAAETIICSLEKPSPPYGEIKFITIENFVPFIQGEYKITPLEAEHDINEKCAIYIIERGGKKLLYANDTGYFTENTWAYIKSMKFDLVSLDCTYVLDSNRGSHMSIDVCHEVKLRMMQSGCDESTVFILNHFSHNGAAIYDELLPLAKELGFDVSYDGKAVKI